MEKAPPIERMARVIGHEIRNPLAVINNSVYFVKTKLGDAVDPKVGKHLGIIEAEVRRANELIADMLAFARPLEAQAGTVSVRELLEAAAARERPAGVKLTTAVPAKDVELRADAELARAALRRLVDNAVDAVGEKGAVAVEASAAPGGVDIVVRDSGPGLSAEAREHLFEPFFSTKPRGLGLGLATARKIAERLGGSIEAVESAKGAAFRLRLPAA